RPGDRATEDFGTDRIQLELEAGDDAEVPAAASESPEQVGILGAARADEPAVRRDDVHRSNRIAGPPETPGEIAKPAAHRQAGDTGVRHEAEGRRETVELCLAIDVAEQTAGLCVSAACLSIDPDAAGSRHVEHQPAVADRQPGNVVPAAFDRDGQAVLARE